MTAVDERSAPDHELIAEDELDEVNAESFGTSARSRLGLLLPPVIIVVSSALLWWYVDSAEKIFQDEKSLDWSTKLFPQLQEHLFLTFWSTVFVILIAVPLGIFLTRPKYQRLGAPVLGVATSGQAMPAFGLIVLAFAWLGRGPWTTIWALTFFTILPVLRNTMVGLDQVDRAVIEAGRGMGLTRWQALRQIEIPLAVPVILAGVRTALVINVGMAALAFLIGGGGLGITISAGLKLRRNLVLLTGAGMTAIVAIAVDWVAAIVERTLRPKGL